MITTDAARASDESTHAGDAEQGPRSDTGTPPAEKPDANRSRRGDDGRSTNHTGLTPDSIPVD